MGLEYFSFHDHSIPKIPILWPHNLSLIHLFNKMFINKIFVSTNFVNLEINNEPRLVSRGKLRRELWHFENLTQSET